jgi:hypothetical protein
VPLLSAGVLRTVRTASVAEIGKLSATFGENKDWVALEIFGPAEIGHDEVPFNTYSEVLLRLKNDSKVNYRDLSSLQLLGFDIKSNEHVNGVSAVYQLGGVIYPSVMFARETVMTESWPCRFLPGERITEFHPRAGSRIIEHLGFRTSMGRPILYGTSVAGSAHTLVVPEDRTVLGLVGTFNAQGIVRVGLVVDAPVAAGHARGELQATSRADHGDAVGAVRNAYGGYDVPGAEASTLNAFTDAAAHASSKFIWPQHAHPIGLIPSTGRGGWGCDVCERQGHGSVKRYHCTMGWCVFAVCVCCFMCVVCVCLLGCLHLSPALTPRRARSDYDVCGNCCSGPPVVMATPVAVPVAEAYFPPPTFIPVATVVFDGGQPVPVAHAVAPVAVAVTDGLPVPLATAVPTLAEAVDPSYPVKPVVLL